MNTLRSSVPLKPTSPRRCPHTVTRVARASFGRQPIAIIGVSFPTKPAQFAQRTWGVHMKLKTFLSLISAMSLAASLACVAAPARADDDSDNSNRRGNSRDQDHDRDDGGNHHGRKSPRVVLISLDGAKPDFIQRFINEGVLPRDGGLARVSGRGGGATECDRLAVADRGLPCRHRYRLDSGAQRHSVQHLPGHRAPITRASVASRRRSAAIRSFRLGLRRTRRHSRCGSAAPPGKKALTATWPGGDGADISSTTTLCSRRSRRASSTTPYHSEPLAAWGAADSR